MTKENIILGHNSMYMCHFYGTKALNHHLQKLTCGKCGYCGKSKSIIGVPRLKETKHYCVWVDEEPKIVYPTFRHGFLEGTTSQPKRAVLAAVASSSPLGFQSVIK
jgi:large subunit ribosomal protein L37e